MPLPNIDPEDIVYDVNWKDGRVSTTITVNGMPVTISTEFDPTPPIDDAEPDEAPVWALNDVLDALGIGHPRNCARVRDVEGSPRGRC